MDVCLCVCILCCPLSVEFFATSWSLVQRRPNTCLIRLILSEKGGQGPAWAVKSTDNDDDIKKTGREIVDWIHLTQDMVKSPMNTVVNLFFIHSFIHSFTCAYSPRWTFGLPFLGVSWSHAYRHTVGLLWTSDQPVAKYSTYTGQHNRQTSMPRAWFETATAATKRPQTYALDRAATEIGGSELMGSIKVGELLDRLSDYQLSWICLSQRFVAAACSVYGTKW
jgi:hypothetical protein